MCKLVEITRDAVPSNISIEFERDAACRAIKVVIFNRNPTGKMQDGVLLICYDNGEIVIDNSYSGMHH